MSTPDDWVIIEVCNGDLIDVEPPVSASPSSSESSSSLISDEDFDAGGGGDVEYVIDTESDSSSEYARDSSEVESSKSDAYDTTSDQTRGVEVKEFADTTREHDTDVVEIMAFPDIITEAEKAVETEAQKNDSVLAVLDDEEICYEQLNGESQEGPADEEAGDCIEDSCGVPDGGGSGSGDLIDDEGERYDDADDNLENDSKQNIVSQHVKTLVDINVPQSQAVHRLVSHRREPMYKKDTHHATIQGAAMCRSVGILEVTSTSMHGDNTDVIRNTLLAAIEQDLADMYDAPVGDAMDLQLIGQDITAGTSFEQEVPSAECSTRFDFTPTVTRAESTPAYGKSSNEDTTALRESLSTASGRNNPRTKSDVEVRPAFPPLKEAKLWAADFDNKSKFSSQVNPLQGSSRSAEDSILDHSTEQTLVTQDPKQDKKSHTGTTQTQEESKSERCPQLESIATYKDDEVDITIYGDERYLANQNHVNVKVTFQHRPLFSTQENGTETRNQVQVSHSKRKGPVIKLLSMTGKDVLPPISSKASRETQTSATSRRTNRRTGNTTQQSSMASLHKFTRLPPILKSHVTGKRNQTTSGHAQNKKTASGSKTKRLRSPCDLDVINQRAQWPPFNTYLDKEASERYYRLINWVTSIAN